MDVDFPQLLDALVRGETVIITRDGRPLGRLVPEQERADDGALRAGFAGGPGTSSDWPISDEESGTTTTEFLADFTDRAGAVVDQRRLLARDAAAAMAAAQQLVQQGIVAVAAVGFTMRQPAP